MTSEQLERRGVLSTWWFRHAVVIALAVIATYAFLESRAEWSAMHKWNRALGDASVLFLAVSMLFGPMARLWGRFRGLLPWRREFGIHGVVLAAIHTAIILAGWVEWDLLRLFGFEINPANGTYVMLQQGFGLANVIGIAALVYGAVLALTSNNFSQRFFGPSAWKFVQQSAYVLWAMVVIHTGYFLYLHFLDFHRRVPDPNWLQEPFAALVGIILVLQGAAFLKTWKIKRTRGPRAGNALG